MVAGIYLPQVRYESWAKKEGTNFMPKIQNWRRMCGKLRNEKEGESELWEAFNAIGKTSGFEQEVWNLGLILPSYLYYLSLRPSLLHKYMKEKLELTAFKSCPALKFHTFRTKPLQEAQSMCMNAKWKHLEKGVLVSPSIRTMQILDPSTPRPDRLSHCFPGWAWHRAAVYKVLAEWRNVLFWNHTEGKWQLSDSEERTTESPSHFLSCSVSSMVGRWKSA